MSWKIFSTNVTELSENMFMSIPFRKRINFVKQLTDFYEQM